MNKPEWMPANPYIKRYTDGRESWNFAEQPEAKTFDEGVEAAIVTLLKWLDDPCDKHDRPLPKGTVGITDIGWRRYSHRKDCSQCMAELKGV